MLNVNFLFIFLAGYNVFATPLFMSPILCNPESCRSKHRHATVTWPPISLTNLASYFPNNLATHLPTNLAIHLPYLPTHLPT